MHPTRLLSIAVGTISFVAALGWAPGAQAQAWPTKTINLVVPFAAGGPTDVMARTLSVSLAKSLGQSAPVQLRLLVSTTSPFHPRR